MLTLKEIAKEIEKALNIKTTEIYEEEDVSDAGIEFTQEYSLQHAPYLEKPYIFHHFDGKAQVELLSTKTAEELINKLSSLSANKNKTKNDNIIVSVREYKGGIKAKKLGFIETSSYNNCNNLSSKGISYEAELEPDIPYGYRTGSLPVLSIAATSFEDIIKTFKEQHEKMCDENSLHLISFSIFDKVGQDWTSNFWKLGYGCTARYGHEYTEDIQYKSNNSLEQFEDDFLDLIVMDKPKEVVALKEEVVPEEKVKLFVRVGVEIEIEPSKLNFTQDVLEAVLKGKIQGETYLPEAFFDEHPYGELSWSFDTSEAIGGNLFKSEAVEDNFLPLKR